MGGRYPKDLADMLVKYWKKHYDNEKSPEPLEFFYHSFMMDEQPEKYQKCIEKDKSWKFTKAVEKTIIGLMKSRGFAFKEGEHGEFYIAEYTELDNTNIINDWESKDKFDILFDLFINNIPCEHYDVSSHEWIILTPPKDQNMDNICDVFKNCLFDANYHVRRRPQYKPYTNGKFNVYYKAKMENPSIEGIIIDNRRHINKQNIQWDELDGKFYIFDFSFTPEEALERIKWSDGSPFGYIDSHRGVR